MTFKVLWEKASVRFSPSFSFIERMVKTVYPNQSLRDVQILSGGCANVNIKIKFQENDTPVLLRLYQRDGSAASREQALGVLLRNKVPVPQTLYKGIFDSYHFAFTAFMPGIPLRDVLLHPQVEDIKSLMRQVGRCLMQIASHSFPKKGFFGSHLDVITPLDNPRDYIKMCLHNEKVIEALSGEVIQQIHHLIETHQDCFPTSAPSQLVHGDFDPANILIDKVNGQWKISAVLDWEFAFAGSLWWDVANMLRYSHQMPSEFEDGFIQALKEGDIVFPSHWRTTVNLLNLLCLLDLLTGSDRSSRPRQFDDLCSLIKYFVQRFIFHSWPD